jgi:hypothetical protein
MVLDLNGPDRAGVNGPLSGNILVNAGPSDETCQNPTAASYTLTPITGTPPVSSTESHHFTGCEPETTITSGPTDETDDTPTFEFTSDTPSATFECSTNAGAFSPCTSPRTYPQLRNNTYTFNVRAVDGGVVDPTPATQTFTVNAPLTFSAALSGSVTTNAAVAHPDVSAQVDITGTDDISNLTVTMPYGLQGSAAAVPMCSQANPASCTAASRIGTQSTTAVLDNGAVMTLVGNIFLTTSPNPGAAAGIIMIVPGVMAVPGEIQEFNNGSQQRFVIPHINNMVGPNHIHISRIVFTLLGMTGAPEHPLLTNPSSCTSVTAFRAEANSHSSINSVSAPVPYIAAGCSSIPYTPTISQEFSNMNAGETTGVKTTIDVPQGQSSLGRVRANEPINIAPNFPSFGVNADQCPSSAAANGNSLFDPTGCPPQAKVGTMTIDTLLLPAPLLGDVYLINKSPLPWFGVVLRTTGVDIRLVGVTTVPQVDPTCDQLVDQCQTQISTQFGNLPDQPMTRMVLDLNGPERAGVNGPLSGNILVSSPPGSDTCVSPTTASYSLNPITGTPAATSTQDFSFIGC